MSRLWSTPAVRAPLHPLLRQRLDGWVRMLDVDLDLAQQMLRLPPAQLPVPPIAMPAVVDDWTGDVLAAAVEAPTAAELAEEPLVVPAPDAPKRRPLGAYARRAARS